VSYGYGTTVSRVAQTGPELHHTIQLGDELTDNVVESLKAVFGEPRRNPRWTG
jgi:hypothetical protein